MRIALVIATLALAAPAAAAPSEADLVAQGHAIAEADCARCHAIGPTGDSQLPIAPAFRTLSERYPVEDLEEALAEGIVSGHPEMPEFEFQPEEIDALIAYLQSVQAKQN